MICIICTSAHNINPLFTRQYPEEGESKPSQGKAVRRFGTICTRIGYDFG